MRQIAYYAKLKPQELSDVGSKQKLGNAALGETLTECPDELGLYFHASQREKSRRQHVFLKNVRSAYRARRGSLMECLISCEGDPAAAWSARMLLTAMTSTNPVAPDLLGWSTSRHIKRADVYRLLDRAIGHTAGHRGGWLVVVK